MPGQRRETLLDVDFKSFEEDLLAAYRGIEIEAEDDLRKLAIDIQNRMRELCPVDTGRLRASLTGGAGAVGPEGRNEGTDEEGFFIEIGTHVDYAVFVEFGTSRARAQPFMRPALAEAAVSRGSNMPLHVIQGGDKSIGRSVPRFLKGERRGQRVGRPTSSALSSYRRIA